MSKNEKISDEVKYSAYGARGFYFVTYTLFYISVIKYPNPLRDGSHTWQLIYTLMHITAIYLFLTAADNPGWVEPDGESLPSLLKKDDDSIDTVGSDEAQNMFGDKKDIELSPMNQNPSFGHVRDLAIPPNRGCKECGIKSIPFRAKHCKVCNRCVRKFDHHCFWIGGCVGELNHGKFWLFTFIQALVFCQNIHIGMMASNNRYHDFRDDKKM